MSLDEHALAHLADQARAALGPEAARTLMDLVHPPSPDDRPATRSDLAATAVELRSEMAELRSEMTDLRSEMTDLRGEMAEFRTEIRTEMAEFRTEMAVALHDSQRELGFKMMGWLVTHFIGTASVTFAMAAFLQRGG